jgi:hypothetical protein
LPVRPGSRSKQRHEKKEHPHGTINKRKWVMRVGCQQLQAFQWEIIDLEKGQKKGFLYTFSVKYRKVRATAQYPTILAEQIRPKKSKRKANI